MNSVHVKIEIPRGSTIKYEFNKKTGVIEVDRIVNKPYPYNYGFITDSLWYDGDALDAMVIGQFELHPGVEMDVEPQAIIQMYDGGVSDFKVLCALPNWTVTPYDIETATTFLASYKEGTEIKGVITDPEEIRKIITGALTLGGGICE